MAPPPQRGERTRRAGAAPDAETGQDFSNIFARSLNIHGQVAFRGELTGARIDPSNNEGIWATDLDGTLTLIARLGDVLDVDAGPGLDHRTIAQDGQLSAFNNSGQLAVVATFTDGSKSLFLATIPEPAIGTLALVSGLVVMRSRGRG